MKERYGKKALILLAVFACLTGMFLRFAEQGTYGLEHAIMVDATTSPLSNTAPEVTEKSSTPGKVNLNTADREELMTLDGIGEKKAEWIIDYRLENGSFHTIEDIMKIPGIGEKTFQKLKDFICVEAS